MMIKNFVSVKLKILNLVKTSICRRTPKQNLNILLIIRPFPQPLVIATFLHADLQLSQQEVVQFCFVFQNCAIFTSVKNKNIFLNICMQIYHLKNKNIVANNVKALCIENYEIFCVLLLCNVFMEKNIFSFKLVT